MALGLEAYWMFANVVIGFWPTYFAPLLRGTLAISTVVHAHGLVFLGWMGLVMAQVIVAARGNIRLHRRIGRWGIAYGCVVLVLGLIVGPANAVIKVNAGVWTRDQAARSLLVNVGDMCRLRSGSAPRSGIACGPRSTSA